MYFIFRFKRKKTWINFVYILNNQSHWPNAIWSSLLGTIFAIFTIITIVTIIPIFTIFTIFAIFTVYDLKITIFKGII